MKIVDVEWGDYLKYCRIMNLDPEMDFGVLGFTGYVVGKFIIGSGEDCRIKFINYSSKRDWVESVEKKVNKLLGGNNEKL